MSDVEFVAVGYDVNNNPSNTIKYSSDGKTWTSITSNGFTTSGLGVAYSPSQKVWVAVGNVAVGDGDNNTIKYSSDGKTWTSVTSNGFPSAGYGVNSKSGSVVFCPS